MVSTVYPFTANPAPKSELMDSRVYQALKLLEERKAYSKLTKTEKEFVNNLFTELWNPDAYKYGIIKVRGWAFDFRPFMKKYLVNYRYYGWKEVWSFNKSCIRNNYSTPSHVLEIVEKPVK